MFTNRIQNVPKGTHSDAPSSHWCRQAPRFSSEANPAVNILCVFPENICIYIFLFVCLFVCFWSRTACGILVPWPWIEPGPSAVKAQSPNHWTVRESPCLYLLYKWRHLWTFSTLSFFHLKYVLGSVYSKLLHPFKCLPRSLCEAAP